ncbi:DUF3892 domain-containing protein [Pontibacillus yanchengensis]|uniref:Uncharacterized protein n=1 Tax=Pontibacillus yanchengensis Y32 TaxID=1385514 RepID=A0A0A2TZ76_9BACI|nr:DUF3892 domain-containing protein [Pontibacillus yanchengensis]KGP74575.1 hypothetical protein N782_00390 [Pontibacillus yanchengensis Y32]
MSDFFNLETTEPSKMFDQDFSQSEFQSLETFEVPTLNNQYFSNQDILQHIDPLKYAHQHEFPELHLNMANTHFVDPHYVDGYYRSDGTYVEGYFRDGDGNTNTNRSKEQGGGYIRTNPDGSPFNNLG